MSLLDTLLEAARFIELQERRLQAGGRGAGRAWRVHVPAGRAMRSTPSPHLLSAASPPPAAPRMGILMETTEAKLGTAGYRRRRVQPELFGAMGAPGEFYADTLHSIAINTRETEFGSIVEPIPITLKTYKQLQAHGHALNGYGFPQQQMITSLVAASRVPEVERPSTSQNFIASPAKTEVKDAQIRPPPKKKWIKEYLEEEPKSPVSVRVVTGLPVTPRINGVVRPTSPVPVVPPCPPAPSIVALEPVPAATAPPPAPLLDFAQEHSRPRTTSNSHGPPPIPSPPSVSSNGSGSGCSNGSGSGCSSGSAPRAGTREVHNKLEKNRRAHLKECFELLKRQLPATPDDKKTSNLSILGSAIRYIQVLRRKERDCEHEMERLAREKIAAQQRLSALKREISVRTTVRPLSIDAVIEDKVIEDPVNGQIPIGIPLSISASPPRSVSRMETSPPRTLNLSTKLRTLPIQITPTTSQVVRTPYGARPSTLTLTTLAPAEPSTQNGQTVENGVTNALSTLVHPAQIHLPISQVVGSSGLVVGSAALQLLSTSSGLRVLQAPVHTNGVTTTTVESRITKENGIVSPTPVSTTADGSVVVSGLTPIVVSQPATHLLQTHTLTHKEKTCKESRVLRAGTHPYVRPAGAARPAPHGPAPHGPAPARPALPAHPALHAASPRHIDNSYINFLEMVETQMVKGTVAPLTVSAQYLSATTIVKPVVVVSAAGAAPPPRPS